MLTKKEIEELIDNQNSSLKIVKPTVTQKSSDVWNFFSHIYVNDVKQEYVMCNKCRVLLIYKHSSGTHSLSKHIRYCQNTTTTAMVSEVQTNIKQYYEHSKNESYIPNRTKQEIRAACTEFVIFDSRSFKTIGGKGFKNLAQKFFNAGRYLPVTREINIENLLPTPTTVSRYIDQLYDEKHKQLVSICQNLISYTIVVDFWKDSFTGIQYCEISLHHTSNDWKLQCFVLGCYPYDLESHSAINTRKFVESKLSDFGLKLNDSIYVVSDNETKMIATFKSNCQRIGCAVHYINKQLEHGFNKEEIDKLPVACDAVQNVFDCVKKIVAHIKKSQKQTKLSKRVQTYSETRFNGAYHMLRIFFEIFDELTMVLDGVNLNQYFLLDKDLLEQICLFLKVFDEVIEQLSYDKRPTIYKVLPLRQRLLNECKIQDNDHIGLQKLKQFLSSRIQTKLVLHDVHFVSTFLHPSFKQFQIAPNEKQKAIDLVKAEIVKCQSSATSEPSVIDINSSSSTKSSTTPKSQQLKATTTTQNILAQCFDSPTEGEDPLAVPSPGQELMEYIALNDILQLDDDVLMFWKNNQNKFPILSSIVADIYSIPASNTTVERLFSSAGNTISNRRTNLNPDKVNKLLFLNKNLLLLKELDRQQLVNAQKKRKLSAMSTSSSSSSNNVYTHDEQEPLSSTLSSSTTKKIRTFDNDLFSDEDIINKDTDISIEDDEQE
ncbi:unnamed protein product [Rotaria sordida]|uniref:BED-type domain-containing protein n=1 Tax=Rotaria sordida TaxID=392033 RepID=A0A816EKF1_9BILA|nr:unnamed protein product [Rotaria sordida]CAF1649154.1 unnamed protein product [Rotaria sordida]